MTHEPTNSKYVGTSTETYRVNVPATVTQAFTHDLDGNLTSDGVRTFEWDAKSQLTKTTHADGSTTEYVYDSQGRRIRIIEKDDLENITADKRYLWLDGGTQPFEERTYDGGGTLLGTVQYLKRGEIEFNPSGVVVNKRFYTKDHSGSVRDLTDSSGNVQAMYDYDPYGRRTRTAVSNSTADTVVSYTGHHWHEKSGVYLTMFRQYDPELGRWLSRDPIEEEDDINLYCYVGGNPINGFDLLGLARYAGYANGPENKKDINTFKHRSEKGAEDNVFSFDDPVSFFSALLNTEDVTRLDLHGHGNHFDFFTGTVGARIEREHFDALAQMIAKGDVDVAPEAEIRLFACDQHLTAQAFSERLAKLGRGDISVTGGKGKVYPNTKGNNETHAIAGGRFTTYKGGKQISSSKTMNYK